MRPFAARRVLNASVLVLASVVTLILWSLLRISVHETSVLSGWALFGLMVALSAYNAKKKAPFFPSGRSAHWLQFHIYAGLLTGVLFFAHVGLGSLHGGLETALAALYGLVFASGGIGLLLDRTLSRRLSELDDEILYERIPLLRRQVLTEAEDVVLRATVATKSPRVGDFYTRELRPFFESPGRVWALLPGSKGRRHKPIAEIDKQSRYMTPEERTFMEELAALLRQKSTLDSHWACQTLLKGWLFVHVPATYSLLLVALVHAVIAQAFMGGSG